jgi:hypothetical protein
MCAHVGGGYLFRMGDAYVVPTLPPTTAMPSIQFVDATSVVGTWVQGLFRFPRMSVAVATQFRESVLPPAQSSNVTQ